MALKPDREYNETTDITNFWYTDQTSAEKGGVASVVTQGSGAAIGQNYTDEPNVVSYATSASGAVPKGILLQTVSPVMSTNRDFINYENQEIRPGDKCTLVKKGFVVTDMITGTPVTGGIAYLGASGNISTTSGSFGGTATPVVGRFETTKDANGFARVSIDIG
ncbi:MAG: hypothetical protein JSW11_00275 [Candidatus Heimdallarchaeota archaeon]|nr:MAG: hypothetical protein JSW11_00275 [Candidatus Heimdallarchaeota archaeon]